VRVHVRVRVRVRVRVHPCASHTLKATHRGGFSPERMTTRVRQTY
jgi:hypothetical protein